MIKKAVIPAAGLGTRFLPATKSVPKEMLPIVDAPIIFYVIEEAVKAGIEDIILIQGRGKTAIEDFFDVSYELEDKLAKDGKTHLLDRITKIRSMANLISVRQKQPLGLGHAVLCARPVVGNDPFAVLLGDEIMVPNDGGPHAMTELVEHFDRVNAPVVAVMEVKEKEVSKYGIANPKGETSASGIWKVGSFVEKPKPSETKSRWALPGRYVFTSKIFELLSNAKPGVLGEIQLTDSMNTLCKMEDFYASGFSSSRYDAGDKLGYLQANVELSLRNPELKDDMKSYVIELAERLKSGGK